jgi:hypothetical protein
MPACHTGAVTPSEHLGAEQLSESDRAAVSAQLGRPPRGAVGVGYRCACGVPAVVTTAPRLPDGTPFPTMYYLTCGRLNAALSTLEAVGFMRQQAARLAADPAVAAQYREAHERYLAERAALDEVAEIATVSAGGMPDRVKCLHALAAQSLASGPGVNPVGDAALAEIGQWWRTGSCAQEAP